MIKALVAAALLVSADGARIISQAVTQNNHTISDEAATDVQHNGMRLRALFQNPHWECFVRDPSGDCRRGWKKLYEGLIADHDIDIAGLSMGPAGWKAPAGYDTLEHVSGPEWHHLAWKTSRWAKEKHIKTEFRGGRAAIFARFRSVVNPEVKIVVASMHYPHDKTGVPRLRRQLASLADGHTDNVLFLADTNVGAGQGCGHLMKELGVKGEVRHTLLRKTCCADGMFGLEFDRIWSNFGSHFRTLDEPVYMSLTSDLKDAPAWAKKARARHGGVAAYHHPVMAELYVPVKDGYTTLTTTTTVTTTMTRTMTTTTKQNNDDQKMGGVQQGGSGNAAVATKGGGAVEGRPEEGGSGNVAPPRLAPLPSSGKCGSSGAPENAACKEKLLWAYSHGKYDTSIAEGAFAKMEQIAGVHYLSAAPRDFQRLAFCGATSAIPKCGLPPCDGCSNPPCDTC